METASAETSEIKLPDGFTDLTGDPVYDHLKTQVFEGYEVVGGKVINKTVFGPKEPRKLISILVKNKEGKLGRYSYSYKKVERMIRE